ncbi:uncharacterized protein LOC114523946 [Dendronephthya gigantea]|uniref:uncharacterized protein LOC114523946 n=1 Tax=Dendronephthya gigantea TaxID=151771 RepID=UPI00106B637D|nr:uncharacterized protein LOC114523946 [Dendronephthya gigantea]
MTCRYLIFYRFLISGVNYAFAQPTWQSSTEADGVSSRAVDGCNYRHDQNTCMQTKLQYEPWWAVDLGQELFVTGVRITNRADCCWGNLRNFEIRVGMNSTEGGKANPRCGPKYTQNVGAGQTVSVNCMPPLLGQILTVSIPDANGTLNFCEVEVYGNLLIPGPPSSIITADLTSSSFTIIWSRPSGIISQRGLPLNYTVCVKKYDSLVSSEIPKDTTSIDTNLTNNSSTIMVYCRLVNGSLIMVNDSVVNGTESIFNCRSLNGTLVNMNGSLVNHTEYKDTCRMVNGSLIMVNDSVGNGTEGIFNCRSFNGTLVIMNGSLVNPTEYKVTCRLVNGSLTMVNDSVVNGTEGMFNCRSFNGTLVIMNGNLVNHTEYTVNCRLVNGSLILVNDSLVNGTEGIFTCRSANGTLVSINGSLVNHSEYKVTCRLVNGSLVMVNDSVVNGTEDLFTCRLNNGTLNILNSSLLNHIVRIVKCSLVNGTLAVLNSSLVNDTDIVLDCKMANGSLVLVNDSVNDAGIPEDGVISRTCSMVNGSLVIVSGNLVNGTEAKGMVKCRFVNGSLVIENNCAMVHNITGNGVIRTVKADNNCTDIGDVTLFSINGLRPRTKYTISITAQSNTRFGPEAVANVTTMEKGGQIIYVELISRILEDVLFSQGAKSYSSIAIQGQQRTFDGHGMHFIVLDPKTGSQTMQGSFNTHDHSSASTQMTGFLSTIPKPSIILMVVYFQAHDYYTAAPLLSLCPNALSSYTSRQSWSMICLNGFGTLPWVTSLTSNFETGPAVIRSHILLPKELKNAPNLTNVVATSARSVELNWTAPENFTGVISYYQICYQRSNVPVSESCSKLSAGSDDSQAVINGLLPYRQYIVRIRGVVPLGYGPYSDALMATTHQAEPSRGPAEIFPTVNTSAIMINWTLPLEEHRNGVINQFSVCYKPGEDSGPCVNETIAVNRTFFVGGLRPHFMIRFEIRAATIVGFGPPTVLSQRTAQAAPDGPPNDAHATHVGATSISLSWSPPDLLLRNGWIIRYIICVRVYNTSSDLCQQRIELGKNTYGHTVTNLKPYTKYFLEIIAGTIAGDGPHAFVVNRTLQTEPSGPPTDIKISNFTHSHMNVTWSPPDPSERNGVITAYWLCIKNQSHSYCLKEDILPFTQTSYFFPGLRPYRIYSIDIKAATKIGFGPIGKSFSKEQHHQFAFYSLPRSQVSRYIRVGHIPKHFLKVNEEV